MCVKESQAHISNGSSDEFSIQNGLKERGKLKAIPLQAWTVPEGSRRLRHPDFKTVDT
jgi:hypothetical protein